MKGFRIKENAYDKIMHWVHKASVEVSGLGIVTIGDDNIPVVEDVMLLEQSNTATTTDIEPLAICKALTDFMRSGKDGDIKFWWHSHVNMDVFWSGTDNATIKELSENGWFLHTVFNKRGETRSAISQNVEMFNGQMAFALQDDVELEVIEEENRQLTKLDKIANKAFNKWQKLKEIADRATENAILAKDDYDQAKGEALELKCEEWDKEFDAKVTEKSYNYNSNFFNDDSEEEELDSFNCIEASEENELDEYEEEIEDNDSPFDYDEYPMGGMAANNWNKRKPSALDSNDELVAAGFKVAWKNGVKVYTK